MRTPWGASDFSKKYAPGVVFYSTPSHGGFKLSAKREAELDARLREVGLSAEEARLGYDTGWYEEDCSANAVVFGWPELFSDLTPDRDAASTREDALATLKRWVSYREERA